LKADADYCRDLTRRHAANFYWGFLALPRPQRTAIYALYSFARQVDDDADETSVGFGSNGARSGRFDYHRQRVRHCFDGGGEDPVTRMLSDVVVRYGIPQSDLEALINGVEMDLQVSRYETWEETRRYCMLVASTVGRMCVRIFGFADAQALEYADELGVAMQLTNILRDVREDMELGRVYLPQEELRSFGVSESDLERGTATAEWEALARFEIERAHHHFDAGLRVTGFIPRRAAACVLTMAGMYQAILEDIERDPCLPLSRRVSLSGKERLEVAMRSWLHAV
jgi:phytoene synthase